MTPAKPSHATRPDPALELDAFVAAFEIAAGGGAAPDLAAFLPPSDHHLREAVLRELVRVDLEFAWSRGTRRRVEEYRNRFPELFDDPEVVRDLVREEFRLRKTAGESPGPCEYRERLGVDLSSEAPDARSTHQLNGAGQIWHGDRAAVVGDVIPPGYHLTGELGRGAFGRVFLAREEGLGGRPVAIKLSARQAHEPVTLARLQHTNIVPVYSAHRVGRYTALVMPFVGRTTLADVVATFRTGQVPHTGQGFVSTLAFLAKSTEGVEQDASTETEPMPAPGRSQTALEALERMTFVEAVLWIGAELADGLSHAHDRGVLHRDIKPANVLFTDDGRPMLLDFNLATIGTGQVAGTPGYMAPEQLAAAADNRGLATPQTDIYALGLILVELLAGRLPFDEPRGPWEEVLPQMVADRQRSPLDEITFPRDVTPGVLAILARCLDPDPANRYATAAELREDLNRQRTHQPLKFARERSFRERLSKWARRHPRLSSGGSIALTSAVVVGALMAAYLGNQWRLERKEAELARDGLRDASEFTQSGGPLSSAGEWRAVRDAALAALAPYRVESDDWINGSLVTRLPEDQRTDVRRDAAQLMFRAADASAAIAVYTPADRVTLVSEALEWNRRARAAYPGNPTRPHLRQRADLLRSVGEVVEAEGVSERAKRIPEPVTDDPMELGFAALYAGDYTEAAVRLRAAARSGLPRYSVWMGLAAAESRRAHHASAIDALSAASALRPSSPWPLFHRGLARMELKDYTGAAVDFDRFLELEQDDPDGYLNRGIVRLMTGDFHGAVADFDRSIELKSPATRVYVLREKAKRHLGDVAGADNDLKTFLETRPTDPLSWCARGERKLTLDPRDAAGALADFEEALARDPNYLNALRGKASVLGEDLRTHADAIVVLDKILNLVPDAVGDRAGRAVLLARIGKTADARREVEACGRPDNDFVLYQLASAVIVAGDKPRGLGLLRSALRKNPSLATQMPTDPDLQSVWSDTVFLNLIAAARTLSSD